VQSRRLADALVVVLALWLLWPQHAGGYGLGHDMVFTPDQPLNADSLGLGTTLPRAVPLDALVALAGKLVGGMVAGRLALLVPLLAAGWGMARLARDSLDARLPALLLVAGCAVWNPLVVERLAIGQWALLWCYGALPWLIRAADRIRRADRLPPGTWAGLVLALGACAITPTGAVIGAVTAAAVGWRPGRRGRLVGLAVAVQLPWLLPALTSTAAATSDPGAVAAFAARAERPGGALGSLLGLGGIWSADVTPASRAGVLGYLTALAVLVGLAFGLRKLLPRFRRLAVLAAASLLLAAAGSVPVLAAVLRWAVRELPGAGLLRDGQKWLLPFVLLAILAAGAALNRVRGARLVLALAAAALPLLLLPDGPATLRVPLTPVHYPAGWRPAAALLDGTGQRVLVLPFASYRLFDWAPGRTVLDPAPRLLPAPTVVDDRLVVGARVLRGEDRTAARAAAVLAGPAAALPSGLAGAGIGWVLVEQGTPGPALPDLSGLSLRLAAPGLRLYRVPGPIAAEATSGSRTFLVILADLLLAGLVSISACAKTGFALRTLLHSPVT
jgi:hypothetical protein